jgi:hypothetical protein
MFSLFQVSVQSIRDDYFPEPVSSHVSLKEIVTLHVL